MGARILCGAQQWSMETWRAKVAAGGRQQPVIAPSVSRALRPIVPSDPYLMD
jgi:hypothetical protein